MLGLTELDLQPITLQSFYKRILTWTVMLIFMYKHIYEQFHVNSSRPWHPWSQIFSIFGYWLDTIEIGKIPKFQLPTPFGSRDMGLKLMCFFQRWRPSWIFVFSITLVLFMLWSWNLMCKCIETWSIWKPYHNHWNYLPLWYIGIYNVFQSCCYWLKNLCAARIFPKNWRLIVFLTA